MPNAIPYPTPFSMVSPSMSHSPHVVDFFQRHSTCPAGPPSARCDSPSDSQAQRHSLARIWAPYQRSKSARFGPIPHCGCTLVLYSSILDERRSIHWTAAVSTQQGNCDPQSDRFSNQDTRVRSATLCIYEILKGRINTFHSHTRDINLS